MPCLLVFSEESAFACVTAVAASSRGNSTGGRRQNRATAVAMRRIDRNSQSTIRFSRQRDRKTSKMVCSAALSSQSRPCVLQSTQKGGQRLVARPVPFGSSTTAPCSVQMQAKGKGAGRRMSPTAPAGPQMVRPPIPEVDPDNEEFCIFTRATSGTYQNWIFVSVVKGGSAANTLVKSLETEWGRKLYGRTLIQNIGNAVYKDKDAIVKGLKGQIRSTVGVAPQARLMEPLLNQPVTAFEFAFKIQDKTRPGDFQKTEGLTLIPKESEIAQLPLAKFQQFFNPANLFA